MRDGAKLGSDSALRWIELEFPFLADYLIFGSWPVHFSTSSFLSQAQAQAQALLIHVSIGPSRVLHCTARSFVVRRSSLVLLLLLLLPLLLLLLCQLVFSTRSF
ncbi:uncharacterized protein BP01DRAFT_150785 [Aspergillus saccharolyticus JOP 1030-1]|uniref:Transmembrane protein n=1 Tax=Aspergillus saccharolyticus JOP 1030-1 TaxID=1450539 RepID=A0A318ZLN4_9EURO|nr:hypothetical protein BP01DRAFT_150785 [Aspergillus saccharolyticus JOP 1030-1]PYH48521.1 hypothetical protein BP01DRAFT_150785 [Aspergillus saccharolyticus JOP 1030-1]